MNDTNRATASERAEVMPGTAEDRAVFDKPIFAATILLLAWRVRLSVRTRPSQG
jgi:hypothetical protein